MCTIFTTIIYHRIFKVFIRLYTPSISIEPPSIIKLELVIIPSCICKLPIYTVLSAVGVILFEPITTTFSKELSILISLEFITVEFEGTVQLLEFNATALSETLLSSPTTNELLPNMLLFPKTILLLFILLLIPKDIEGILSAIGVKGTGPSGAICSNTGNI